MALGAAVYLCDAFFMQMTVSGWSQFCFGGELSAWDRPVRESYMAMSFSVSLFPWLEELIFRRWVIEALVKRVGSASSLIFSAILFTSMHYQYFVHELDVMRLMGILVFGVVLGCVYLRTGSVVSSTIVHCVFNAAILVQKPDFCISLNKYLSFSIGLLIVLPFLFFMAKSISLSDDRYLKKNIYPTEVGGF